MCLNFSILSSQFSILSSGFGTFQVELLDAVADLIAIEAQQSGCARLVPLGPLERLDDQGAFELIEIDSVGRKFHTVAEPYGPWPADGEVVGLQHVTVRKQHRALDRVPEFADVPGPPVGLQALHG